MWIMLNDGFLSIVKKGGNPGQLCVRARRQGDIERVFPGVKVTAGVGTDYMFRAWVDQPEVAKVIAARIMFIDYNNMKNSVREHDLHDAYMNVWTAMFRLQRTIQQRRPQFDPWAEAEELDAMGEGETRETASPNKKKECQNKRKATPRRK